MRKTITFANILDFIIENDGWRVFVGLTIDDVVTKYALSLDDKEIESGSPATLIIGSPNHYFLDEIEALREFLGENGTANLIYSPFTSKPYQESKKDSINQVVFLSLPFDSPSSLNNWGSVIQLYNAFNLNIPVRLVTSRHERERIYLQLFQFNSLAKFRETISNNFNSLLTQHQNSFQLSFPKSSLITLQDMLLDSVDRWILQQTELHIEHCYARIGLMGNPSDGFQGKTLSFLIKNFAATVIIQEQEGIELKESNQYSSSDHFLSQQAVVGYNSGGMRLLLATVKVFLQYAQRKNINLSNKRKGFKMIFSTTIPRMVGLSGSSAIIVAAFRGLLKFYGLTIDDFGIAQKEYPEVILNIEKEELGISAGLQDRVIQTYGGLVHMDFTRTETKTENIYTPLDPHLLPPLYLIFNTAAGGDSGKVHSTVKERWAARDPSLIEGMQTIGGYADQAKECLLKKDYIRLGQLMESNFQMRRQLYSDAVVGEMNIRMANAAKSIGLSVKFTGSGGAFVALRSDGSGWFSESEENKIRQFFHENHFEFVRIAIP